MVKEKQHDSKSSNASTYIMKLKCSTYKINDMVPIKV